MCVSSAAQNLRKISFVALLCGVLFTNLSCGSGTAQPEPQATTFPPANVPLVRLSSDPYSNTSSQHATEVEPDTFAFGSTIVSAFQVGRVFGGGGADIGFATSIDAGTT